MTDTGSFKYASTSAKTHRVVADLIEMGIDNSRIHDLIYDNSSSNRINLLAYCLYKKLLLYPKNNSAILSLSSGRISDEDGFLLPFKGDRVINGEFVRKDIVLIRISHIDRATYNFWRSARKIHRL